jgi:HEAT repeat protein
MTSDEQEIERLIAVFGKDTEEEEMGWSDEEPFDEQTKALRQLFLIGEPVVPFLNKALDNENKDIACWSANTLKAIEAQQAFEPFLRIAQNRNEEYWLRATVISGLELFKIEQTTDVLLNILAAELTNPTYPSYFPGPDDDLAKLVAQRTNWVLGNTIRVLGGLGNKRAVEPLMNVLTSSFDKFARQSAALALGHLQDTRAFDVLIKALDDENDTLRKYSMYALAELKDARAFDKLVLLLKDKDYSIRDAAISAIGELRHERSFFVLYDLLKEQNTQQEPVGRQIVHALGKLGDKRAFEGLANIVRHGHRYTALFAALALGEIGDVRAFDVLLEVLKKTPPNFYASIALGKLKDPRAFDILVRLLEMPESLGVHATTGLGALGNKRAIPHLLKALDADYSSTRYFAAEALGDLEAVDALPKLAELALNDHQSIAEIQGGPNRVSDAAVEAIKKIRRTLPRFSPAPNP